MANSFWGFGGSTGRKRKTTKASIQAKIKKIDEKIAIKNGQKVLAQKKAKLASM